MTGWLFFRRLLLTSNLLALPFAIGMTLLGHPLIGFGLGLLVYLALHWAMFHPGSRWLGPVFTAFAPSEAQMNEVWLTLDDGPDPQDTPVLLDLLKAHNAKVTFFFIGQKAAQFPELVRRAAEEGHGIGHHTFSHPAFSFWLHSPAATGWEMTQGRAAVAQAAGLPTDQPLPFRVPAGIKNPFVHAHFLPGEPLVAWSARAFDCANRDPKKACQRLIAKAKPGAILLMHEGVEALDGSRLAPQVLAQLLNELDKRKLRPTVPTLAQLR